MTKPAKEWFGDAAIFAAICRGYEARGLVANAECFRVRSVYALAMGLKTLVIEGLI